LEMHKRPRELNFHETKIGKGIINIYCGTTNDNSNDKLLLKLRG
jgi:hypothetical protein